MKILITGGTGSLGKELLKNLVNRQDIERLVIFSRDELKQWQLSSLYPESKYPKLRFFLGDVRDRDRLKRALHGIDYVVPDPFRQKYKLSSKTRCFLVLCETYLPDGNPHPSNTRHAAKQFFFENQ